jgi:hypothetical protein
MFAELLWGDPKYFTEPQRQVTKESIVFDPFEVRLSLARAFISHQAAVESSKDKTL